MRRAQDFGELLDEKLREDAGSVAAAPVRMGPWRAAPAHPLLYAPSFRQFSATAYAAIPTPTSATAAPPAAMPTAMPRVPAARLLTPRERLAFNMLNRLGAKLGPDFTRGELRSAYRALARRFHPDRHVDCSTSEQARLSRLFAEITEHHDQLCPLVEPTTH